MEKNRVYWLLILMMIGSCGARLPSDRQVFKLSVFYDMTYGHVKDITAYSTEIINRQLGTLHNFEFEVSLVLVEDSQSYKLSRTVCHEIDNGLIAIIGIGISPSFLILQAFASNLKIPYISVTNDLQYLTSLPSMPVIHMHPTVSKLMSSIEDLIDYFRWEYITLLYQESYGFERIQDLIRPSSTKSGRKFRVLVRQLSSDITKWTSLIKDIKSSGTSHIIVDIETRHMNEFIRQANEVGLMTAYFHFIFTSLDLAILDYAPSANITAVQIFEPNSQKVANLLAEFNFKNMIKHKPLFKFLPSYAALIFDSFNLLGTTIYKLNLATKIDSVQRASCQAEIPWEYGLQLANFLRLTSFVGVSGYVEFDSDGQRTNMSLAVVDLAADDTVDLVGFWYERPRYKNNIEILRSYAKEMDRISNRLNRHLNVTTKIEAPYVMLNTPIGNETLEGNAQYRGFCVSMLEKISKICNFTYTIRLVEDGLHGTQMRDGKWNGIVRELIDKKSDLAVAALTISFQREQVIDFTKPFLNLGISILYKRPQKKMPSLFSFLAPLSVEIWLYMIAAYLVISFFLFVLARFSPYEWRKRNPCHDVPGADSNVIINDFTLFNSLWFTIGSLMQQGIDFNPKSCSTRILTGAWWFFALIMISSYTANLAAFLTTKRLTSPIEDAEGLSRQSEIKYGCLNGGSTQQFFKESKIQTYERMWNFMSNNPENFVPSTEEGIERIKNGGYAYLVESITNEYARARDCELMQVGGLLDTKGYGIGTPTGSPWREKISNAILQMQENGELQELYSKWWIQDTLNQCDRRDKLDNKVESASELSLASVGGVFAVLAVGLGLAFIVAILEFFWISQKKITLNNDQISMTERMVRDWKFAACNTKARLHHSTKKRSISVSNRGRINDNDENRLCSPSKNRMNEEASTPEYNRSPLNTQVVLLADSKSHRKLFYNYRTDQQSSFEEGSSSRPPYKYKGSLNRKIKRVPRQSRISEPFLYEI